MMVQRFLDLSLLEKDDYSLLLGGDVANIILDINQRYLFGL